MLTWNNIDNLEYIYNLCKLSLWQYDITKDSFTIFGFFNLPPGHIDDFLNNVYPTDRASFKKTIIQCAENKILFEKMFRLQIDENKIKWVFMRGSIHSDAEDVMSGVLIGINDWKRNQDDQYSHQLQLMELIQHSTHNGMISQLTHELTQPLMVINTYISGCIYRLNDNKLNNKQLLDVLKNVKQNSALMGYKIHQLKDFINESHLQYHVMNIHDVIAESISLLSYELQNQGINISYDLQDNLPDIKMNKNQIKEVLYNLIKGSIENVSMGENNLFITTKEIDSHSIKVTIKDNNKNNIGKFADINSTLSRGSESQGLKMRLAMCRTIIEAHGGSLSVKSSAKGSHYQFTLHG